MIFFSKFQVNTIHRSRHSVDTLGVIYLGEDFLGVFEFLFLKSL